MSGSKELLNKPEYSAYRSLVSNEFLNGYLAAKPLSFGVRLDDRALSPPDDPGASG